MKTKKPWTEADRIARRYIDALSPFCERIEIAGSLRRHKAEVGDIEIVCIPKPETDMFGTPLPVSEEHSAFRQIEWILFGEVILNGPRQKKIILREGIQLDLFVVLPPAQWGVIFLIRTGSAEFSHQFVTAKNTYASSGRRGLLPSYLKVMDGAIWKNGNMIPTPEEKDVFELIGMDYIEPEKRK